MEAAVCDCEVGKWGFEDATRHKSQRRLRLVKVVSTEVALNDDAASDIIHGHVKQGI